MKNKKFELTQKTFYKEMGITIYRIKAVKNFTVHFQDKMIPIHKGALGGWVQHESNLSHSGNCWIFHEGLTCHNAIVKDNAILDDEAIACGNATLSGNAIVTGTAQICENATITDNAYIDDAQIGSNMIIKDNAEVVGYAYLSEKDTIIGKDTVILGWNYSIKDYTNNPTKLIPISNTKEKDTYKHTIYQKTQI